MICPSHSLRIYRPAIWWKVQVMKFLFEQFARLYSSSVLIPNTSLRNLLLNTITLLVSNSAHFSIINNLTSVRYCFCSSVASVTRRSYFLYWVYKLATFPLLSVISCQGPHPHWPLSLCRVLSVAKAHIHIGHFPFAECYQLPRPTSTLATFSLSSLISCQGPHPHWPLSLC